MKGFRSLLEHASLLTLALKLNQRVCVDSAVGHSRFIGTQNFKGLVSRVARLYISKVSAPVLAMLWWELWIDLKPPVLFGRLGQLIAQKVKWQIKQAR